MMRQEADRSSLSYRQVLRALALEAVSRILQGQGRAVTSSEVIQMAEDLFQWVGWGSEEPEEKADGGVGWPSDPRQDNAEKGY